MRPETCIRLSREIWATRQRLAERFYSNSARPRKNPAIGCLCPCRIPAAVRSTIHRSRRSRRSPAWIPRSKRRPIELFGTVDSKHFVITHVYAVAVVLIADNRDPPMLLRLVLHLNGLRLGRGNVGSKGQQNRSSHALLDRHLRTWILASPGGWIDRQLRDSGEVLATFRDLTGDALPQD